MTATNRIPVNVIQVQRLATAESPYATTRQVAYHQPLVCVSVSLTVSSRIV